LALDDDLTTARTAGDSYLRMVLAIGRRVPSAPRPSSWIYVRPDPLFRPPFVCALPVRSGSTHRLAEGRFDSVPRVQRCARLRPPRGASVGLLLAAAGNT